MQVEVLGKVRDAADHALQHLLIDGRPRAVAADLFAGHRAELLQFVALGALLRGIVSGGKARGEFLANAGAFFLGGHAITHQSLLVKLATEGPLICGTKWAVCMGRRLRQAVAAIADHVDDRVLLGAGGIERDLHHAYCGIGIVAVDVEEGRLHTARDVGGIRRGARFVGQRREADLIVDDQVYRAAGGVAVELRKIQRLGDHALSGEGRIAVNQHRDDAFARRIAEAILLGTDDAFDHGIDSFSRRGDRDHNLAACRGPGRRGAEEDTSPDPALRDRYRLNPLKICLTSLPTAGKNIEACGEPCRPPVRGRCGARRAPAFLPDRERGLPAFQRESLRPTLAAAARTLRPPSQIAGCMRVSRSSGQLLARLHSLL